MTEAVPSPARVRHRAVHLTHPEAHIPGFEMPDAAAPPLSRRQLAAGFVAAVVVALVGFRLEHATHGVEDAVVAAPWMAPFGVLLACIAGMPFVAGHFWERHYAKIAVGLGFVVAMYYLFALDRGPANVGRAAADYVSFIFLLGSLFVVSGGILIRVRARATPLANAGVLLAGAVLANVLGTTGASVLLVRPYLRMNKAHLRPFHVVFFIFIVSNCGGSLTPIGDPPLFLGFLTGVPFFWVMQHCWPFWAMLNGVLLTVFLVLDGYTHTKQARRPYAGEDYGPSVSVYGATNVVFVGLILAGILLQSDLNRLSRQHLGFEAPWREWLMAVAAFGSLATTPARVHGDNHFNYAPIKEVAFLFVGIFLTMTPALNYLYHNSAKLHLTRPGQYYFATGGLSSVLDNAPTYLTFLKAEMGALDAGGPLEHVVDHRTFGSPDEQRVARLTADPLRNQRLVGISMGAVLFGAMTYIGNGPNFMVKSIADHAGVETPGFFRYVYAFSLPVLLPVLALAWWTLLR